MFAGLFGTSFDAACAPPEAGYGTNSMRRPTRSTHHSTAAFTMVEIALSLAVIGFALVAIIGILPTGMNVQKENREETIINQDASVLMDAIRNGERGLDDLTNYVLAITNYQTRFDVQTNIVGKAPLPLGYTYFGSWRDGAADSPPFRLTNGFRIVGLLSTPKFTPDPKSGGFYSNYVVGWIRSMSGGAGEKFPQTNQTVQDLALSYRVISDIAPHVDYDRNWTNFVGFPTNSPEYTPHSNYWMVARNLQANLHDLRLIFRWPLFVNGNTGNGRQAFRTMVSGHMLATNDRNYSLTVSNLYFFEPRSYVRAP